MFGSVHVAITVLSYPTLPGPSELNTESSWFRRSLALCKCSSNSVTWSLSQIDESELKQHQLFGCFFDSQAASSQIFAEYHNCQFVPRRNVFQARANRLNQTLNEVKNQVIRASVVGSEFIASRKTAALSVFLFKELGPLTAAAFMPVVLLVYLLALPVFGIVQMFVPGSMRVETNLCSSTLALHLLWDIVHTFWSLCIRMSNAWNVYMSLSMLLFATQVNNSLYRDGMDAIGVSFNIVFNLVLPPRPLCSRALSLALSLSPSRVLSLSFTFSRASSLSARVCLCVRANIFFKLIADLVYVVSRDAASEGEARVRNRSSSRGPLLTFGCLCLLSISVSVFSVFSVSLSLFPCLCLRICHKDLPRVFRPELRRGRRALVLAFAVPLESRHSDHEYHVPS